MVTKTIAIELAANEVIEIQLIRKQVEVVPVTEQRKPEKRFYDLKWLEDYLGTPRSSIYQMTSKNSIPHIKRGRKLYFDKKQIDRWLEEGNVKTTAEIKAEAEDFLTKRGRRVK